MLLALACAASLSAESSSNTSQCLINRNATPSRQLDKFFWLHFPKAGMVVSFLDVWEAVGRNRLFRAGSSFATTLYHYACDIPDGKWFANIGILLCRDGCSVVAQ